MRNHVTPIRYVHADSPDFTDNTYNKIMDLPGHLKEHKFNLFSLLRDISEETDGPAAPTEADFQNLSAGMKKILTAANFEFMGLLSHWHKVMNFVRVYDGDWTDRATGQEAHRAFYDEREWRAASEIEDDCIAFKFNDIRHVIVTSEEERNLLGQQLIDAAEDLEITDQTQIWSKIQVGKNIFGDV